MILNEKEIEDKVEAVRKKLKRGVPEGEIKEELLREGYTKEEIEAYFFKPHHYDMRNWYLIFAVIVLLIGLWMLLNGQGFLPIILSGLLFWQYSRETQRLKNLKDREERQP